MCPKVEGSDLRPHYNRSVPLADPGLYIPASTGLFNGLREARGLDEEEKTKKRSQRKIEGRNQER